MCNFFSLISDGKGKIYYFDWQVRKQILDDKLKYETDSHTSIADYFGFRGEKEDKMNKYEYNPLLKVFKTDQLNATNDAEAVEKQCRRLNFRSIVPALKIQKIIHPLNDMDERKEITPEEIQLLEKWASVRDSVGDPVWASVRDSVRNSVGDSVWAYVRASVRNSVGDSVWASVRDSVRNSVGDSVWDSVGDSVRDSVGDSVWSSIWDSVWAYVGSFFNLEEWKHVQHAKGQYPFQPAVDLWLRGLVPSFDGELWRLHTGREARVIWGGKLESPVKS